MISITDLVLLIVAPFVVFISKTSVLIVESSFPVTFLYSSQFHLLGSDKSGKL